MKKFTIFLLTFLLFVGFINVNAQNASKNDDGSGGPSRTTSIFTGSISSGLLCSPGKVLISFNTGTNYDPLSNPVIYRTFSDPYLGTPVTWQQIQTLTGFGASPNQNQIWFQEDPLNQTAWYYATIDQGAPGNNTLTSDTVRVAVLAPPTITITTPSNMVCEGGSTTVNATVVWPDIWTYFLNAGYPPSAVNFTYSYQWTLGGTPVPGQSGTFNLLPDPRVPAPITGTFTNLPLGPNNIGLSITITGTTVVPIPNNNCDKSATITINVVPPPTITLAPTSLLSNIVGGKTCISNSSVRLSAGIKFNSPSPYKTRAKIEYFITKDGDPQSTTPVRTYWPGGTSTYTSPTVSLSDTWTVAMNNFTEPCKDYILTAKITLYAPDGITILSQCVGTVDYTLTVVDVPDTPVVSSDSPKCEVGTFNIEGNVPDACQGVGQWSFIGNNHGAVIGNVNSGVTTVSGVPIGEQVTVRWTITNPPCASKYADLVLKNNRKPTVTFDPIGNVVVCTNKTFDITAIGAGGNTGVDPAIFKYTWTSTVDGSATATTVHPSVFTVATQAPKTGSVTVVVEDGNGCTATATKQVRIKALPTQAEAQPQARCGVPSYKLLGNNPASGETGVWSIVSSTFGPASIASIAFPNINFLATINNVQQGEEVLVEWKISDGICDPTISQVKIINLQVPTLTLTPTHQTVCQGDEGVFFVATATGGNTIDLEGNTPEGLTFNWVPTGVATNNSITETGYDVGPPPNNTSTFELITTNPGVGAFTVYVTDGNGCTPLPKGGTIITNPKPILNWAPNQVFTACQYDDPLPISVSVTNGIPPFTYEWTLISAAVPPLTGTSSGNTYTLNTDKPGIGMLRVTVTDRNGCTSDLIMHQVRVFVTPKAIIDETGWNLNKHNWWGEEDRPGVVEVPNYVCPDHDVISFNYAGGYLSEKYYVNDVLSTEFVPKDYVPTYPPDDFEDVVIKYVIENSFNCKDSTEMTVTVLLTPQADFSYGNNNELCATGVSQVPTLTPKPPFGAAVFTPDNVFTITPDNPAGPSYINADGTLNLGNMPAGTYKVFYTFRNNYCENYDSTEIVVYALPDLEPIDKDIIPCAGADVTMFTNINNIQNIKVTHIRWFFYDATSTVPTAPWVPVPGAITTSVTVQGPPVGSPVLYRVIVVTDKGCEESAYYTLESAPNPVVSAQIAQIASPLCNHSMVTLNATINANAGTTQTYQWFVKYGYKNTSEPSGTSWVTPFTLIPNITGTNGSFLVSVDLTQIDRVQFELVINTDGFNCPFTVQSNIIDLTPNILAELVGDGNDTICHGGNVEIRFALKDHDVNLPTYYRWYENNLFFEGIGQIHTLPQGQTEIYMATQPSLHNSEDSFENYCYTVEVWQGNMNPMFVPCTSFSQCHNVVVYHDPVVYISGPVKVGKGANPAPEFLATVVGGYGDSHYQWYLNGVPEGDDAPVFSLSGYPILGIIGDYNVSVKVTQEGSGCEADLVIHYFSVACPEIAVTIEGPTQGCVGSHATLTAVVTGAANENYDLVWYSDATPIPDQPFSPKNVHGFVVEDKIDVTEYYVEISNFCDCDAVVSPAHYFQTIPKAVVTISDYEFCKGSGVDVFANAIAFGGAEIYRYIWYDAAQVPTDTTYINTIYIKAAGTYYVSVEMLNAACSGDLVEFKVTENPLPVIAGILGVPTTPICAGDEITIWVNNASYPNGIFTWYKNGVLIEGANLFGIMDILTVPGDYRYDVKVFDPTTGCESEMKNTANITVVAAPISAQIAGKDHYCSDPATVSIGVLVTPIGTYDYVWYKDGFKMEEAANSMYLDDIVVAKPAPYYYYVEATNEGGCKIVSNIYPVTVTPAPVIPITASTDVVCNGGTITFTADASMLSNNVTYEWYVQINSEGPKFIMEPTTIVPFVTFYDVDFFTGTHIVTLEATDNVSGCVATSNELEITVNDIPVIGPIQGVPDGLICAGSEVTLYVEDIPGAVYTWFKNGILMNGATLYGIMDILTIPGEYRYDVKVSLPGAGCESELINTGNIMVMAAPISAEIGGQNIYCGATADVNIGVVVAPFGVGYHYTWYRDITMLGEDNMVIVDNVPAREAPYNYYVEVSNDAGCKIVSAIYPVTVNPAPVIPIYADNNIVCIGGDITFTADASSLSNSVTYEWYVQIDGAGPKIKLEPTTYVPFITFNNLEFFEGTHIITLVATDEISGCVATSNELEITVNEMPELSIEIFVPTEDGFGEGDGYVCVGTQVYVTATPDDGELLDGTYTWFRNGVIIEGVTNFNFYDFLTIPGYYEYNAILTREGAGCVSPLMIPNAAYITAVANPISAEIAGQATYCGDEATVEIGVLVAPIGAYTYKWYRDGLPIENNNDNPMFLTDIRPARVAPYNYYVEATTLTGDCKIVSSIYPVTVNAAPVIAITASDYTVCLGGDLTITAEASTLSNSVDYTWTATSGNIVGTFYTKVPFLTLIDIAYPAGTYKVTLTAYDKITGCNVTSNEIEITIWGKPYSYVNTPPSIVGNPSCPGNTIEIVAMPNGVVLGNPTNTVAYLGDRVFTWYKNGIEIPGATLGSIFVTTEVGVSVYSVKVTLPGSGCESPIYKVNVITYPRPTVEITGNQLYCGTEEEEVDVTLQAFASQYGVDGLWPINVDELSFAWYMDNELKGTVTHDNNFTIKLQVRQAPYNFSVEVHRIYGSINCRSERSAEYPVYINPTPVVGITASKLAVCEDEVVMLSADIESFNGMTFQWYADGEPIDGANAPVYYATVAATTTYTFTATTPDETCVATSNEVTVEVVPTVDITVEEPLIATICVGEQVAFTADTDTDNAIFTWYVNGIAVAGADLPTLTYTFDHYGEFEISVTASIGCASEPVVVGTVTVEAPPTVTITGPSTVCQGGFLYAIVDPLDANVSINWYIFDGEDYELVANGDYFYQITQAPSAYPYVFVVEVNNGICSAQSLPFEVYVEEFPTIGITADKTKICPEETVKLTADVSGALNMIYAWFANGGTDPIGDSPILYVNPSITTIYTFTATQNGSECVATSNEVTVVVVPIPEAPEITAAPQTICVGGAVKLTATYVPGATYTWYRNGNVIQGAVLSHITDFPTTYGELTTEYLYAVAVIVAPGCTSALSEEILVTVTPQPEAYVEGPSVVCEGQPFTLTGYPEGSFDYIWTQYGYQGVPADVDGYLAGFAVGFGTNFDNLLSNPFVNNHTSPDVFPPYLASSGLPNYNYTGLPGQMLYGICNPVSTNATSLGHMYDKGVDAAGDEGADAAVAFAGVKADALATSLEGQIIALAEAAAAADAAMAGQHINGTIGENQGTAYAMSIVTDPFLAPFLTGAAYNVNNQFGIGNVTSTPSDYTPSCYSATHNSQIEAYKWGYSYGYKTAFKDAYPEAFAAAAVQKIVDIYLAAYNAKFAADYNLLSGTMEPADVEGVVGTKRVLVVPGLDARDYPYRFRFIVYSDNGCQSSYIHEVTVLPATPAITGITMLPEDGLICEGGQVTLTAVVADDTNIEYYKWFENGIEIQGKNLKTILVSPLPVGQDTTYYIYNVIAVLYGNACPSAIDPENEQTVTVRRNPIIELHGLHHVCDDHSGAQPHAPNFVITAYKDGGFDSNLCGYPIGSSDEYLYYKWYREGNLVFKSDVCNAQEMKGYEVARTQPYLYQVEYDAPNGCQAWSNVFELYVHLIPEVNITATESEICVGGITTLRANLNNYNEENVVFQWYKNGVNTSNMILGATQIEYTIPAADAVGSVVYWVSVKNLTTDMSPDSVSCKALESFTLQVYPKPEIAEILISETHICSGGQVILTAVPSENNLGANPVYTWYENGLKIEGATLATFTKSLMAIDNDETIYTYNATVKYENSGCESVLNPELAQSVTVYRNPVVDIAGIANVCETTKVFLQAHVDGSSVPVGNATYTWYESGMVVQEAELGAMYHSRYYPPRLNPYKFTVEVTRGLGCTTTSEPFYVNVHTLPVVNITTTESTICEGGSVVLTANLNDYNTEYITYQWYELIITKDSIPMGPGLWYYFDVIEEVLIPGATLPTYNAGPLSDTSHFKVEVIQTHSSCSATDIITINVTPIPDWAEYYIKINTGAVQHNWNFVKACQGSYVSMYLDDKWFPGLTPELPEGTLFYWDIDGVNVQATTSSQFGYLFENIGYYRINVTIKTPGSACVSLPVMIYIDVVPNATVQITGTPIYCVSETVTIDLTANIFPAPRKIFPYFDYPYTGTEYEKTFEYQYQWLQDNVDISGGLQFTQNGIVTFPAQISLAPRPAPYVFKINVIDPFGGCITTAEYEVIVNPAPVVYISASETTICKGGEAILTAEIGSNPFEYILQWYRTVDGVTDTIPGANGTTYIATDSGTYTLTATHIDGCVATSNEIEIKVTPIPNWAYYFIHIQTGAVQHNWNFVKACQGSYVSMRLFEKWFDDSPDLPEGTLFYWDIDGVEVQATTSSQFAYLFDKIGYYRVNVYIQTPGSGCVSLPVMIYIDVVPNATVQITGDPIYCASGEAQVTLDANVFPAQRIIDQYWEYPYNDDPILNKTYNYQYQWLMDNVVFDSGLTVDGVATFTKGLVPRPAPYVFKINVIDPFGGCITTAEYSVTVNSTPTVAITASETTICEGGEAVLTAEIGSNPFEYSLQWYKLVDGENEPIPDAFGTTYIATEAGIYTFTATHIDGCVATSNNITITIIEAPFLHGIIPVDGTACVGSQFRLRAVVEGGNLPEYIYTWYKNGNVVPGQTAQDYTEIYNYATGPFIYSVTVELPHSGCVSNMVSYTMTVSEDPNVIITGNTVYCTADLINGVKAKFIANVMPSTNFYNYTWSIDNLSTLIFGVLGTGYNQQPFNNPIVLEPMLRPRLEPYHIKITVEHVLTGCTTTSEDYLVYVHENLFTEVGIVADKTEVCSGGQVVITASNYPTDPDVTFQWYANGAPIEGETAPVIYVYPEVETVYTFEAIQSSTGCNATSNSITIFVIETPVIEIDEEEFVEDTICKGEQLTFTVSSELKNVTFKWFVNDQEVPGATLNTLTFIFNQYGEFTIKVSATSNVAGCSSVAVEIGHVVVKNAPGVHITGPVLICAPNTAQTLTAVTDPINAEVTYQWYLIFNGEQKALGTAQAQAIDTEASQLPYTYFVVITDPESGCEIQSAPHIVNVHQNPQIGITTQYTQVCENFQVQLTAYVTPEPNTTYQWWHKVMNPIYEDDVIIGYEQGEWAIIVGADAPIYYATPSYPETQYKFEATVIGTTCVAGSNIVTIDVIKAPVVSVITNPLGGDEPIETICTGEQLAFEIEADIDATINWFVNGVKVIGASGDQLVYIFETPGHYTFKVSATSVIAGCTSESIVLGDVYVKPAPTVEILGLSLVCEGSAIAEPYLDAHITPMGATLEYQWYIDGNEAGTDKHQPIDLTARIAPYIYVVVVTDLESGCTTISAPHIVYVHPQPVIAITSDKLEVCSKEVIKLSAEINLVAGFDYQWYADGEPIPGANAITCYYAIETTTTFTFTANGEGCNAISTAITVVVSDAMDLGVEEPTIETICVGDQVMFTTNLYPNVEYTWYINGDAVPGAILNWYKPTFNQPGVYIISVSATTIVSHCLSDVFYMGTITVKAPPTVSIEGPDHVCNATNPAVLQAVVYPLTNNIIYQWYEDGSDKGNSITQPINSTPKAVPYIYTLIITDTTSGCTAQAIHHVLVEQLSNVGITASKYVACPNDLVVLTADVPEDENMLYQWYVGGIEIPNANAPVYNVYPTTTSIYSFTATQIGSQCTRTSNTIQVDVIPTPVISVTQINDIICQGKQVTYTATKTTDDPVTYTWLINGMPQGATEAVFTHTFNTPGTFVVEVYATTNVSGCKSATISAGTITVKAPPTVAIYGPNFVCNTENPEILQAIVTPSDATVIYQWKLDGVNIENGNGQTQAVTNVPKPTPYIYVVEITDTESGCTAMDVHEVNVGMFNEVPITINTNAICQGATITLTANVAGLPTTNMTYQWFDNDFPITGATSTSYSYIPGPGTHVYTFVATEIVSECAAGSNSVTLVVSQKPEPPVLTISDNTICSGEQVTITALPEGVYNWYKNGVLFASNALNVITDNPTANNTMATYNYTAEVTINGCTSNVSAQATVAVHPVLSVVINGGTEVCEQALGSEHLVLHAIVTGLQTGVTYYYKWTYRQGIDGEKEVVGEGFELSYIQVPNNLPPNGTAAPYCFQVEVTAVDYDCVKESPCHNVNILVKPTVQLEVDNDAICLGGTIKATAHPTPAPLPGMYNYKWTVNGVSLSNNEQIVNINPSYFTVGVNNICVEIELAQGSKSCFGSNCYSVNVLTAPSLALTQAINGLQLPGMCVGGEVNLTATITDFDETLINPDNFTYKWRRNTQLINHNFPTLDQILNEPGLYKYEVMASYIDNTLGCDAAWTQFADVKVVPQANVAIDYNGYTSYDVCQGATVQINTTLNITDAAIQTGFQYCWNNLPDCAPFTNQIAPQIVELNIIGNPYFFLKAEFSNPTCKDVTSNTLTFHVVSNPDWTVVSSDKDGEMCLGETIKLTAAFEGGVGASYNVGKVQWVYTFNGGPEIPLALGNNPSHTPKEAGLYQYIATYIPSNTLTGCSIEPYALPYVVEVIESITPTAQFASTSANWPLGKPHICGNDPYAEPVELVINFTGTAPYFFKIIESTGTVHNLKADYDTYSFFVSPKVTTTYTLDNMTDQSKCITGSFIKSDITVVVTDIEVLNANTVACKETVDINLKITSWIPQAKATVVFAGETQYPAIKQVGNQMVITITIPASVVNPGDYAGTIEINGCVYPIVIYVGKPSAITAQFTNSDPAIPQICASDPVNKSVDLFVHFEGTPPFTYLFVGTDGTKREITSYTKDDVIKVSPTVTTKYYIELLSDASPCATTEFEKPEITVIVTDVQFITTEVATCDQTLAIEFNLISARDYTAKVTVGAETLYNAYEIHQGSNSIPVNISGLPFGTYTATVSIDGCDFTCTVVSNYGIENNLPLILRRWENYFDVLMVSNNPENNGGYQFTSYQWYKNGELIPGATNQYYQDPNGVNGLYSVRLTGKDINGNPIEFRTCDKEFLSTSTLKVYPVPAQINEPVYVDLDLTPAEMQGATLDIYDTKGALVKQMQIVSNITRVEGFNAQGTYFGKITTGTNEIKSVKFVIVK